MECAPEAGQFGPKILTGSGSAKENPTTKRHRRHSTARKREIVEAYFNGESTRGLSQKYDVCRTLIPIRVEKYERGEFDDDAVEEELLPEYQARIAALERLVVSGVPAPPVSAVAER